MRGLEVWNDKHDAYRSIYDGMFGLLNEWDRSFSPPREARVYSRSSFAPPCDVNESENGYVLSIDVPGFKKEDISIEAKGKQVVVSGERKKEEGEKIWTTHRMERNYGTFHRSFELPEEINTDTIDAFYESGVLRIAIPKAEASKPKRIQIQDNSKGVLKWLTGKAEPKAVN